MNIYPKFDYRPTKFKKGDNVVIQGEISTCIRKKFDGVYYLYRLVLKYEIPVSTLKRIGVPVKSYDNWVMNICLQELITNAYKIIKFGKLNSNLRDLYGLTVGFIKDPNQISEIERLYKI